MYGGVSPDDLPRPHLFASKNIREPKDRRLKSLFPLWPAMALCSCEINGCMPACCCCNPGNEALNRASQGNRPLATGGRETTHGHVPMRPFRRLLNSAYNTLGIWPRCGSRLRLHNQELQCIEEVFRRIPRAQVVRLICSFYFCSDAFLRPETHYAARCD